MKALILDLTRKEISWANINQNSIGSYLGGRGLGVRYLYDELAPGTDPLGPENILSMWTSPIMGLGTLSMVKLCGVTRSPATGTILMSLMGGYFGPELRFAGVDGLVIKGVAQDPVYLLIQDGKAELRSAEHLWGKTTKETHHLLEKELNLKKMQIACIGPAGENKVAYASIMHGGDAMGRGGIGAVMGSKRLKAIVASGRRRLGSEDPQRFRSILKKIAGVYHESQPIKLFGVTGTTHHVNGLNSRDMYPTRNFQSCRFEDYKLVNAESLYENHVTKRLTCFTCTVRCRRVAEVKEGPYADVITEGPEYETLWSFGGNCGNKSLDAIIAANELCLEYGLDTISTGATISFAMECFTRGLLSLEDTGGLELNFGNHEAMLEMIHKIGRREGLGDVLAQGTRRAAKVIGGNAIDYAMQVKGLELAGYEPRGAKGMGLGYATSPRGGCHERGYLLGEVVGLGPGENQYAYEGKGALVKTTQDAVAVKDALGFCVLSSAGTSIEDLAELFSAVTGIERTADDLLQAGERICNLERLFNLREGFTRAQDALPRRFLKEAVKDSKGELHTIDIERLLDDYYLARGWDTDGKPLPETLKRLGIADQSPGASVISPTGLPTVVL